MLNKETIELLKGLKVEVKNFLITNNKEPFKLVTVGGYEVLHEKSIKDLTEDEIKAIKLIGKGETIDSKEKLLPFIYVKDMVINNKDIENLLTTKGKKSLSKEEAVKLNKGIGNTQVLVSDDKAVHGNPRPEKVRLERSSRTSTLLSKEEVLKLEKVNSGTQVLTDSSKAVHSEPRLGEVRPEHSGRTLSTLSKEETLNQSKLRLALKLNYINDGTQVLVDGSEAAHGESQPEKVRPEHSGRTSTLLTKEELEDKIVYIFEENPSTNSLALAKQFDIRADNVLQNLMNTISLYPSLINSIKVRAYEIKNGNNKDVISYFPYYEINEEIYNKFINSMGEPKSIGMKLYRTKKKEEYFKGFQNLRQHLYNDAYLEREVQSRISGKVKSERKLKTKELMKAIHDFVTHYNNSVTTNKINEPTINRLFFNLSNRFNKVNALTFDEKNREQVNINKQEEITKTELTLAKSLRLSKELLRTEGLQSTLLLVFRNAMFEDIDKLDTVLNIVRGYLMDYSSLYLWNNLPK